MILRNFKGFLGLLFLFFVTLPLVAEEKIDIWKNNKSNKALNQKEENKLEDNKKIESVFTENLNKDQPLQIEGTTLNSNEDLKIFGVYDPESFNFNLNMWTSTNAEDVRASIKRIKKIKLSKTSNEILENILLSFAYPPEGMDEKEFVNLKVNWMIENNRTDLLEEFLKQNKEFDGKSKAVQYLVDENISKANIKEGCNKIKFIDSTIKDSYLEKFKIYCFVFNKENAKAQLLLDLLREQNQSDKFFDDKINFLLGISKETSSKINEKNLLNFYLSSVTIKDFNYSPSKKTKKVIWKYLNAANLIKIEDVNDKERIKELEIAASLGQVNENIIFGIYKQIPFNLNTLINAKNIYQTLDQIEARSLIFQKYLLVEDIETKLEYLFLLDNLFEKANLKNIYSNFLSDKLKEIESNNIPDNFKEKVEAKILNSERSFSTKIKYNDKVLHQSKIIKFYIEDEDKKKMQKDIDKVFRKINKNKKYFFSAKDLALIESLIKDGFNVPDNSKYQELSEKYEAPKNLVQLIEKKQNAFLALKIVEIIGEDEPHQLDPETIYLITNLLNEMNLINFRNKVLISALPLRV